MIMSEVRQCSIKILMIIVLGIFFLSKVSADTIPGVPFPPKPNQDISSTEIVSCCSSILLFYDKNINLDEFPEELPLDSVPAIAERYVSAKSTIRLTVSQKSSPFSWNETKQQINQAHPFVVVWQTQNGSMRCVLATGYLSDSSRIRIADTKMSMISFKMYQEILRTTNGIEWIRTITFKPYTTTAITTSSLFGCSPTSNVHISRNGLLTILPSNGGRNEITSVRLYNYSGVCVLSSILRVNSTQLLLGGIPASGLYYIAFGTQNAGAYMGAKKLMTVYK